MVFVRRTSFLFLLLSLGAGKLYVGALRALLLLLSSSRLASPPLFVSPLFSSLLLLFSPSLLFLSLFCSPHDSSSSLQFPLLCSSFSSVFVLTRSALCLVFCCGFCPPPPPLLPSVPHVSPLPLLRSSLRVRPPLNEPLGFSSPSSSPVKLLSLQVYLEERSPHACVASSTEPRQNCAGVLSCSFFSSDVLIPSCLVSSSCRRWHADFSLPSFSPKAL